MEYKKSLAEHATQLWAPAVISSLFADALNRDTGNSAHNIHACAAPLPPPCHEW